MATPQQIAQQVALERTALTAIADMRMMRHTPAAQFTENWAHTCIECADHNMSETLAALPEGDRQGFVTAVMGVVDAMNE